jgi:hypothetical protein
MAWVNVARNDTFRIAEDFEVYEHCPKEFPNGPSRPDAAGTRRAAVLIERLRHRPTGGCEPATAGA